MSSEILAWLKTESERNAQMQGDKQNTNQRRKTFRHRNHMLIATTKRIKELESTVTGHKLAASLLKDHIVELWETLEMVRDADNDCHKDGLQTIPPAARKAIDAALKQRMDR